MGAPVALSPARVSGASRARRYGWRGGRPVAPSRAASIQTLSMTPDAFNKQYLVTAGPTPLPPAVSQVMAEPILYHRSPAFIEIYERVLERLSLVFQTSNPVLTFAASGSNQKP